MTSTPFLLDFSFAISSDSIGSVGSVFTNRSTWVVCFDGKTHEFELRSHALAFLKGIGILWTIPQGSVIGAMVRDKATNTFCHVERICDHSGHLICRIDGMMHLTALPPSSVVIVGKQQFC